MKTKQHKFSLGKIVITTNAAVCLTAWDVLTALMRHVHGDWGDICQESCEANEFALREGLRLFSAYQAPPETEFWVITQRDRRATAVLLPEDYCQKGGL